MVNILLNNNNNNNKRRMSIRKALADSGCSKNIYYNNKDHTNYITAVTASTEHHHHHHQHQQQQQQQQQQTEIRNRTYVLIKHIIPKK